MSAPLDPRRERLIRTLLRLYPTHFRRDHGPSVVQSYRDALDEADRRGASSAKTWLWLIADAVRCAVLMRVTRRSGRTVGADGGEGGIWALPGTLRMELALAVRSLGRAPGFALVVIATMGLGIGANAAIFAVVHGVLLEPLPYEESDELVWLMNRYASGDLGAISGPELWEYRQAGSAFTGMAGLSVETANLTGLPTPAQLRGMTVSPGYFDLLGAQPVLGRGFLPQEEEPGHAPVVVISHRLWIGAFGADPEILGRSVLLDGDAYDVVGVMGSGHTPLWGLLSPGTTIDFWLPHVVDPSTFDATTVERHGTWVLGRLAPSADRESAETELRTAVQRLESTYPEISNAGERDVAVLTLRERIAGDVTGLLFLLTAAVALVLVLACVNVTNLLVARGETRASEVAVRAALGAGRSRLVVHVLSESVVIGLLGGVAGFVLAMGGHAALSAFAPELTSLSGGSGAALPVLLFSLVLSLVAGGLAGAIPGVYLARGDLVTGLKAGGRDGPSGSRRPTLRRVLVVVQVAGAVVLVAGAGLLTRTVSELRAVDPGFDGANLRIVSVNASSTTYETLPRIRMLYEALESEIGSLPGVESVTVSWQTPLQSGMSDWPVQPQSDGEAEWFSADPNYVTPSYFETYGITVLDGRTFDRADLERPDGPVILNETAARRLWPGESAVGKRVNLDFRAPVWREVIGVVADIKGRGLGQESRIQTYLTLAPGPFSAMPSLTLTVRSRLDAESLRSELARVMARVDPDIPIGSVVSMREQADATMRSQRLLSVVLSIFGAMALLLGSIGVYGLMAYHVQRRRREIGLRLAVGADRSRVLGLIVGQGLVLGAVGVGIGLFGAVGLGTVLEDLLFGVTGTDASTLAIVSLAVLAVTALASFGPARRAASVDPLAALREE